VVDEDATVIELKPHDPRHKLKRRQWTDCRHKLISVYENERRVECRTCGAQLDPYTILLEYAHSDERWWMTWKEAEKKARQLSDDIPSLERRVKNLKAQAKRAAKKLGHVAVEAHRLISAVRIMTAEPDTSESLSLVWEDGILRAVGVAWAGAMDRKRKLALEKLGWRCNDAVVGWHYQP
jgi:hypothetical protein